jgi:predicted metal-binding protein
MVGVPTRRQAGLFALIIGVLALSACGSSGKSSGGSNSGGGSSRVPGLVAKVEDANVVKQGSNYVTSAKITVGGVPGRKVTLQWGLVDALQGNESQDEIVLHRYVLTKQPKTDVQTVKIPASKAQSPILIHFVLYDQDGTYLASDDTPNFGKGA